MSVKDYEAPRPPRCLNLVYYPDPILSRPCVPVLKISDEIRTLAYDMVLTMMTSRGIGLAAPQVGHNIQMFVADIEWDAKKDKEESKTYVFINPKVELLGDEIPSTEGCLSFPKELFDRKRFSKVQVQALDDSGAPFLLEAEGLLAVVIQHEFDHLQGKTVADDLSWLKRNFLKKAITKRVDRRFGSR